MVVANASLDAQRALIGSLANIPARLAADPLPSPCLIVVGSVVRLATATSVRQFRKLAAQHG